MTAEIADRVLDARGRLVALPLDEETDGLLEVLRDRAQDLDDGRVQPRVRLVLGSACSTALKAVPQLVAALQLPYSASRGWSELLEAIDDRAAFLREIVVVADATDLLRHEDPEVWYDLVLRLRSGPHCLGGGWNTLVLIDSDFRWRYSRFGSAAGVEAAATRTA